MITSLMLLMAQATLQLMPLAATAAKARSKKQDTPLANAIQWANVQVIQNRK